MSCDTSSPNISNGYCDDELNTRHCDFDGSDCCLKTEESHAHCEVQLIIFTELSDAVDH